MAVNWSRPLVGRDALKPRHLVPIAIAGFIGLPACFLVPPGGGYEGEDIESGTLCE